MVSIKADNVLIHSSKYAISISINDCFYINKYLGGIGNHDSASNLDYCVSINYTLDGLLYVPVQSAVPLAV